MAGQRGGQIDCWTLDLKLFLSVVKAAVAIVMAAGYKPGQSCRYIQHHEGKLFFYEGYAGNGKGAGPCGPESWRLDFAGEQHLCSVAIIAFEE